MERTTTSIPIIAENAASSTDDWTSKKVCIDTMVKRIQRQTRTRSHPSTSHRQQIPLGVLGKVGTIGMLTLGAIQAHRVPKVNLVRVVAKAVVLSGRTRLAMPARADDQSHHLGALLRRCGAQ